MTPPVILADDHLRDARVIEEFRRLSDHDLDYISSCNRRLKKVLAHNGPESALDSQILFRGVGLHSPLWQAATKKLAPTSSEWVKKDYKDWPLPDASYWSDPELKKTEVFWAVDHSFGGDHPECWQDAQKGIVLAHPFKVLCVSRWPSDAELLKAGTAWKLNSGDPASLRDECLTFGEIECFWAGAPWELLRKITACDEEADVLLGAAYINYLKVRVDLFNDPLAMELLRRCGLASIVPP